MRFVSTIFSIFGLCFFLGAAAAHAEMSQVRAHSTVSSASHHEDGGLQAHFDWPVALIERFEPARGEISCTRPACYRVFVDTVPYEIHTGLSPPASAQSEI